MSDASHAIDTIALIGNPNAGKTTIFNALTGENHKVGNYAGVTVEVRTGEGRTPHGRAFRVIDLPGCYSLNGRSPDERLAGEALAGRIPGEARPDRVVCIVDASHLERHLHLALEVLDAGLPCVVALNMIDMAENAGIRLDSEALSAALGVPVIPLRADRGRGVVELKHALARPLVPRDRRRIPPPPGEARRAFVHDLCEAVARRPDAHSATAGDRLDGWLLHPFFGWMAFLGMMFCLFWTVFSFAAIPMGWIEAGQAALAAAVEARMPEGDLRGLLVDGVIGGVGGVLMFLPQIVLLFLLLGLLESSGYMARAVYLTDGAMSRAGLGGRSFLPLFSSYACAIPGVMAARTITSPKERLVAIFVAPWMSCSARLPVYFLIVPLLLHEDEGSWKQALVLFGIYAAGTLAALVVARVLRGRLGPDERPAAFMLELPPYRAPQWRYLLRHVADRAGAFVRNAGTVILGLSILLWALSTYPKPGDEVAGDASAALGHSAMGRLGAVIEPAMRPLGLDGRTGTAILTSFAAREVFVASMAILFRAGDEAEEEAGRSLLRERIAAATRPDGTPLFTPLSLVSLLVFFIYALQCLPTSVVVAREAGSWKWALGQFLFMSGFAYLAALTVYQGGRMLGF